MAAFQSTNFGYLRESGEVEDFSESPGFRLGEGGELRRFPVAVGCHRREVYDW